MNSLAQLASKICDELNCGPGREGPWKAVRLEAKDQTVPASKALQHLKSLIPTPSAGWLLAVNIPRPLQLPKDLGSLGEVQWIEAAEVVSADGSESWHYRDLGQGQCLITHFTESPDPDAVLIETSLLGSDGVRQLKYRVSHQLQAMGDHQELRPVCARFVGFN